MPDSRALLIPAERRFADHDVVRALPGYRAEDANLSLGKIIRGQEAQRWEGAEAERRAMSEGVGGAGGYTVPVALAARIIDLIRNKARVMQAGATTVPLSTLVTNVARQASDPTVSWTPENGEIPLGSPTFENVQFTARALKSITLMSKELVDDSSTDVTGIVETALAAAFALELDRVALYGTGAADNQPLGVKLQDGITVTSLGTDGAAPTWDDLSKADQALAQANFEANAVIANPRTFGDLDRQKDSQGRYLEMPKGITDLKFLDTNQVGVANVQGAAADASDIFIADWRNLWVGMRSELRIEVLRERYADAGQIGIFAWLRCDVQLAHAAAFNVIEGAIPAA